MKRNLYSVKQEGRKELFQHALRPDLLIADKGLQVKYSLFKLKNKHL